MDLNNRERVVSKNETSSDFVMMAHTLMVALSAAAFESCSAVCVVFKTNGIHRSCSDSILLLACLETILLIGMNRINLETILEFGVIFV